MSGGNYLYFDPHIGLAGNAGLRPTAFASIDTSLILDQAAARLGANVQVVQTMGMGSIRHFAPMRVANELALNYATAARRYHIAPERMYALLNQDIMPRIRFVDLPPIPAETDWRLKAVSDRENDPNGADPDVAYLGLLLSPALVLSRDRDHRLTGFAPRTLEDLNRVLAAGLSVEISDGAFVTTGFVANLGATGASTAVKAIAVRLQIPIWIVLIIALGLVGFGTYWALSTPERREKFGRMLEPAAEGVMKLMEQRAAGKDLLERSSVLASTPSFENRLFRALAGVREPVLVRELLEVLAETGSVPGEPWLRQYMTAHPSFVRRRAHRWQLGRQMTIIRGG